MCHAQIYHRTRPTDIKLGAPLAKTITYVAIVADQASVCAVTHIGVLFAGAKIKVFEPSQLAEARAWIAAGYTSPFSTAPNSSTNSGVVAQEHMKRTLPSMKR